MPKPVKKPRKPSVDPNLRARQLITEHLDKAAAGKFAEPAPAVDAQAIISAHMAKLGAKGGKISGARRLQNLSPKRRKEIATRAAKARWEKQKA